VRRLVLSAAVAAALAGGGGALLANSAPAATQSPTGLLSSALHNAAARGSVHETESGGPTGRPPTLTGSSDITNTGGTEVVHIARLGDADVILIGSQAYLRSTRAALGQLYKFPAPAAEQAAGRWISFARSTSSAFLNLVDGLTLPSALYDVTPQGALTETTPTKINGQAVIGIRGKAPYPVGVDAFGQKQYQYMEVDIDEDTLGKIADKTNGKYFRADSADTLRKIYGEIDRLEKSDAEVKKYQHYDELFGQVAVAGLAVFLLEMILSHTVWRKLP